MKNEVSVFKVILLFIINIFLFSVFYMIGYNIVIHIFNFLMNNISIFNNIFRNNIPYILFTLMYSATIGKFSYVITMFIITSITKNEENLNRSFIGSGIALFIIGIFSFIIYLINNHISFDISFFIGGIMFFLSGKNEN